MLKGSCRAQAAQSRDHEGQTVHKCHRTSDSGLKYLQSFHYCEGYLSARRVCNEHFKEQNTLHQLLITMRCYCQLLLDPFGEVHMTSMRRAKPNRKM